MNAVPEPTTGAAERLRQAVEDHQPETAQGTVWCLGCDWCDQDDVSWADHLLAAAAVPSPETAPTHAYVSTACHHALHDRCRRTCKFCGTGCGCACGHPEPETAPTEEQDSYHAGWEVATTAAREHIARTRAEADEALAQVERVRAVRGEWSRLPVWGPNPEGLHILDDVDVEGLLLDLDIALGDAEPREPGPPRTRRRALDGDQ